MLNDIAFFHATINRPKRLLEKVSHSRDYNFLLSVLIKPKTTMSELNVIFLKWNTIVLLKNYYPSREICGDTFVSDWMRFVINIHDYLWNFLSTTWSWCGDVNLCALGNNWPCSHFEEDRAGRDKINKCRWR